MMPDRNGTNVVSGKLNSWKEVAASWLPSVYGAYKHRKDFEQVQTYCMFIGYPRSGHSLIGSLLAAHPRIVIAHELNALKYIQAGFSRNQLWALILRNDNAFTSGGREWTGYKYAVPNQYQGRFETLQVIGDKFGGLSTRKLLEKPKVLDRLRETVDVETRFVHVVRNPYDNITTHAFRNEFSLEEAIERYMRLCRGVAAVKERVGSDDVLDVRHESFIEDPPETLRRLCEWLGVKADADYLEDCSSIVFDSPRKTRFDGPWTPSLISDVRDRIAGFEWLKGYSYEN
jgi:hypothetical protein